MAQPHCYTLMFPAGSDTEGKFIRCTWQLGKYSASFTYELAFNYLTATNHHVPAHVLAEK